MALSEAVLLGLGYDGQFSGRSEDRDLNARLSWRF